MSFKVLKQSHHDINPRGPAGFRHGGLGRGTAIGTVHSAAAESLTQVPKGSRAKDSLENRRRPDYDSGMPKRPTKSNSNQTVAQNANPRGERLTSKQAKTTSHAAPAKRMSSKVRGR
jgi:hypothetical protein